MNSSLRKILFLCVTFIGHLYSGYDEEGFDLDANTQNTNDPVKLQDKEIHSSVVNLEGEPSAIVNRCVNAISGDFIDCQIDLVVPGPQPIVIQRSYSSAEDNNGLYLFSHGWNLNHEGEIDLQQQILPRNPETGIVPESYIHYAETREGNGTRLLYTGDIRNGLKLHSRIKAKHLTNCGSGEISGRTNLKNTRLDKAKNDALHMTFGSGIKRIFNRSNTDSTYKEYSLDEEVHPSGNKLSYKYDKKSPRLRKIIAHNGAEDKLAHVVFEEPSERDSDDSNFITLHSSQGKSVKYTFSRFNNKAYLTSVERPNHPLEEYKYQEYERKDSSREKHIYHKLKRKNRPDGRFQKIEYYDTHKDSHSVAMHPVHIQHGCPIIGRVKCISAPVGVDDTPIATHSFIYDIEEEKTSPDPSFSERHTDVYNASNDLTTRYCYNSAYRLTSVKRMKKYNFLDRYFGPIQTYSEDELHWSSGNLQFRVFYGEDKCYFCRHFQYDENGNIEEEKLWGNLTGRSPESVKFNNGKILTKNNSEVFVKKRSFDTSLNLMVEEEDGRKTISLAYYPETDLLKHRFTKDQGIIKLRQFYEYDHNAVLIKEIKDDGTSEDPSDLTSVTERHIKYIHPSNKDPIGLPEILEEKYLDLQTGTEKLLSKVVNHYTSDGQLFQQDYYDSQEAFAYSLKWEYDSKGNLKLETNAIGESIERDYDANRNLIYEKKLGTDFHKEMTYDYANRLIREEIVLADGTRLPTTYRYNKLNQKVASYDIYGNETQYRYDFYGRLDEIRYPLAPDENGKRIHSIEKIDYNHMDHPTSKIDPLGHETKTEYTIRGKPYHVVYPDGSEETFEYTLDGLLERSVAKNGTVTHYSYDYLGRLTSKEIKSPSGDTLESSSATYNAFKLISEIDAAGMQTTYEYDAAGRLSKTKKGDQLTVLTYDSRSRVTRTMSYFGHGETDYIVKVQEYDLLNRVTQERSEDALGVVLKKVDYCYDIQGNRCEVKIYNQAGESITKTKYNHNQEPIEIIDSLGNITRTVYHYNYTNEYSQCVACQETIDALGNVTQTIKDTRGRIATVLRKNSFGDITQKRQYFYDANGNRARIVDTVISPIAANREITSLCKYDSCNRLESYTEAAGTTEQKKTSITYNSYGQKETIIKNDGVTLFHEYDPLGRLQTYKSSDASFHYVYTYDSHHNPTHISDEINHTSTHRDYDLNNRLREEVLGNGLKNRYEYDCLGRPTTVTLPDQTGFRYQYEGCYLKEVQRLNKQQQIAYSHIYKKYDLSGSVTADTMVKNGGDIEYAYDLLGRPLDISHSLWSETIPKDGYDTVGNLLKYRVKDNLGTIESKFTYDSLYQLTSEDGSEKHQYVCDSLYNRVEQDSKKQVFNDLNQLISNATSSYTYDLNGNLKTRKPDGVEYSYDALDRLISVRKGDQRTNYVYDSFNRRLSKTSLQLDSNTQKWKEIGIQKYLYHEQNEIGAVDASGKITELRILGSGKGAEIGAAIAIELQGELFAPLHDHNGNVACLINPENAQVEETYRYSAFGVETIYDAAGQKQTGSLNPWRFSSKRVDTETDLVYFGRRYYDPQTARWLTPDPIGDSAGPNLYAYVNNSPLTHFDLYGLWMEPARSEEKTTLQTLSETAFGWAEKAVSSVIQAAGKCLEFIGEHVFVGIPLVGDAFDIGGKFLQGKGLKNYVPFYKRAKPGHYNTGGIEIPDLTLLLLHGIDNSFKDIFLRALDASMRLGGLRVDFVFMGHGGLLLDGITWSLQRLKIPTPSARLVEATIKHCLGNLSSNGQLFIGAHSQGGEVVNYNRPYFNDKETKQMVVKTFGAPCIISKREFGNINPVINNHDIVPCLSPFKYIHAKCCPLPHAEFIDSNSLPFIDHTWSSGYERPYRNFLSLYQDEATKRAIAQ